MRVVVTGAGGQLGTDLVQHCSARGDDVVALDHASLDVTSRSAVLGAVTSIQPDVVVNCAAWTAVDACEADPDRAMQANGWSVRWMAEACDRAGAHLVHVSTDYVFDGTLDRPYREDDTPNPAGVYGHSKLVGEREALLLGTRACVARTSWVFGQHGANMAKTIVRLASERPQLQFVADQVGHPTCTADLAVELRGLALDRFSGIVHTTNQGAVSWFQFAQEVVAAMGKDPAMVHPITTAELQPPRPARRPANSVLDNAVRRAAGRAPLRDFREPLRETVVALVG